MSRSRLFAAALGAAIAAGFGRRRSGARGQPNRGSHRQQRRKRRRPVQSGLRGRRAVSGAVVRRPAVGGRPRACPGQVPCLAPCRAARRGVRERAAGRHGTRRATRLGGRALRDPHGCHPSGGWRVVGTDHPGYGTNPEPGVGEVRPFQAHAAGKMRWLDFVEPDEHETLLDRFHNHAPDMRVSATQLGLSESDRRAGLELTLTHGRSGEEIRLKGPD